MIDIIDSVNDTHIDTYNEIVCNILKTHITHLYLLAKWKSTMEKTLY